MLAHCDAAAAQAHAAPPTHCKLLLDHRCRMRRRAVRACVFFWFRRAREHQMQASGAEHGRIGMHIARVHGLSTIRDPYILHLPNS